MAGVLYIDTTFSKITVKPVHPTFGAQVEVPDWNNLDDETIDEITRAGAKVGNIISQLPNVEHC
jgi:alpha-ketoglutarate-dependent taurine dioxygenase